ncbi:hypothetical protein [Ktedonobacter sp. SOSP1-85]|uniref:hypothetical protein n=1 Tax=Ktedonobacter sp. SOSP1-85 TaxID=2778367 RepID=UPI001916A530|nr:hypothetical protein [Ktedonobacter sp. SOSP1-85]
MHTRSIIKQEAHPMPTENGAYTLLVLRRKPFLITIVLSLFLLLFLAGCGATSSGTGGTGSGNSNPGNGSTKTVKGFGAENGCPSDAVLETRPSNPTVTVKPTQQDSTVTVHKGDVMEVQLPFGSRWAGPTKSEGPLQMEMTAGFADQGAKVCVWRFSVQGTGHATLNFSKRALCNGKERVCAMYIMPYTFTVNAQ